MIIHHDNTVLAAANKDPRNYGWYELTGAKATFEHAHKTHELILSRGEKYGLKEYRGKVFLVDGSDLSIQFSLTLDEATKLVKKSKPWSGKISRYKVNAGAPKLSGPKASGPKTIVTTPSSAPSDSLKGLDILKALGKSKPESDKENGISFKRVVASGTPSTVMRKLTKMGLAKAQKHNEEPFVECDDGVLLVKRHELKESLIMFFKPTTWKKYKNLEAQPVKTPKTPKTPKEPVSARPPKPPKTTTTNSGQKVQHTPRTEAVKLMDSVNGAPLSATSMPVELKDPEVYAASLYGREVSTGRRTSPRSVTTVGYAHIKGKFCLVGVSTSMKGVNIVGFPLTDVEKHATKRLQDPQLSYKDFLYMRNLASNEINNIHERRANTKEESHEKFERMNPQPGMRATIKFSNGTQSTTIVDVRRSDATIGIKGSGKKLRWIPMSMVKFVE